MFDFLTPKFWAIFLPIYFFPTLVDWYRNGASRALFLFVMNLLFGWTIIGWISLLVEACHEPGKSWYGFDELSAEQFNELIEENEAKKRPSKH
jgi:hypothetical protein